MELIFKTILKIECSITTDRNRFESSLAVKFSYTKAVFSSKVVHFQAVSFLFESGINPFEPEIQHWQGFPTFFWHNSAAATLPFDPFAMAFYLVSRYEEYTATELDEHGRFPPAASLAYRHDFLNRPVVNHLAQVVQNCLRSHFPNADFPPPPAFRFLPTYDVDYAWAFRHKGLKRSIGGYLKDFLAKNWAAIGQRWAVQTYQQNDPYFTFEYLDELHDRYHLQPIYFFLVGDYGEFDKNIPIKQKDFSHLLSYLNSRYCVGLHPSYRSNLDFEQLKKEKKSLEFVTMQKTPYSRQHFLKLQLPTTYRNLLKLGIQQDFTMGYAEQTGFRAGIAESFFWYDLEKEAATDLVITPFQVMDVTLKDFRRCSPQQAFEETTALFEATQAVGGLFVTLWHNNSFCECDGWQGWRAVYEGVLERIERSKTKS